MNYIYLTVIALLLASCCDKITTNETDVVFPEGEFTYNLPCRVVYINPDKPGKAIVWLWLHGGVSDYPKHDFYSFNHLDCCDADEYIMQYLKDSGTKAVALFPVCHKASVPHAIKWKDCYDDVKRIIDDYANKNLIDLNRVYVTGSSDGGRGAWDYAEQHPDIFAAAISMSCASPRRVDIPMYFFSTSSEGDCSELIDSLVQEGVNIKYKYCPDQKHGGDAIECTPELLKEFFSHKKGSKQ